MARYDTHPEEMTRTELRAQYETLLELKAGEIEAGYRHIAKDMARRANALYQEAAGRPTATPATWG